MINEELFNKAKEYFNEPVLVTFEVGRLIGYAEDEDDCYNIIAFPHNKVIWSSCVGGFVSLRNIDEKSFKYLDTLLELNASPKQEKFSVVIVDEQIYKLNL